jgi:micrococcal nuclease
MPKRISKDPRSQLVYVILVLLFIGLSWWLEPYLPTNDAPTRSPGVLDNGVYEVLRVVDGDTLLLKKYHLRVRLQGVDTPETVKKHNPVEDWGPEATAFTTQFVKDAGMKVDVTVDGEGVDQYGRHLVFIWHDWRLLNEELIANGLARAKLGYDYSQRMKDRLRVAQDKARRQKLGIWSQ